MWLAGCAEPTASSIAPGSLGGMRSGSIYVPAFDAKPSLVSVTTGEFVAELSSRARVLVVRGNSIAHDSNPDVTSGSMLQNIEAGVQTARQAGANLLVTGEINVHGSAQGVTAEAILQVITLADGSTISRLRQVCTAPTEREAAVGAARQAAQVLAAGF